MSLENAVRRGGGYLGRTLKKHPVWTRITGWTTLSVNYRMEIIMSLFWELRSGSFRGVSMDATEAKYTAREARMRIVRLEQKYGKMLLICEALWSLLREKQGMSENDLVERVNQIDLTDGTLDGRVRRPPMECPKCKRTTPRRLYECIYCGEEIQGNMFAE